MEVEKILQEIANYSVSKEDIFCFLFQESKKYSTLSLLKHLLLSITDCNNLNYLVSSFYHLEYGSDTNEEMIFYYHGREIKKTKKDILLEQKEKLKKVMNEFTNGDSSSFKEIIAYGESISSFLDVYSKEVETKLSKKLVLYEELMQKFSVYDEKILSLRKCKKDAQNDLKRKEPLTLYETKFLTNGEEKVIPKTYKLFKKFAYQKYAMKIDLKIEVLKKEKALLKEEETHFLEEMGTLFSSSEGSVFWHAILNKYEYYHRSISLQEVLKTILLVGEKYKKLAMDFSVCFGIIQDYPKLLGYIKNGNVLPFVCKKIRESYVSASGVALDVQVRKVDVPKPKDSSYRVYGYLELPSKMEELSKVFLQNLKEQDANLFVKKCANFYLDMVIVQPYQVENEKTIRILLSLMLLTHGILLPSTYTVIDKMNYGKVFPKTYGEVETELLMRYKLFYPAIKK